MRKAHSKLRRIVAVSFISAGCLAALFPAFGAEPSSSSAETPATPSPRPHTAQELLIQKLVARGALTPEDAAELLKLDEADKADAQVQAALTQLAIAQAAAAKARANAAISQKSAATPSTAPVVTAPVSTPVVQAATAPTSIPQTTPVASAPAETARAVEVNSGAVQFVPPTPVSTVATTPSSNAAGANPSSSATADDGDDTVRVTYVPEAVKNQLREEIKNDVMRQAKEERWAAPRSVPEWVSRLNLYGDFRFRYEGIYNHKQNDNSGTFVNFNAINTGSPFDLTGSANTPTYNVDQDRNRVRVRARFGVMADLGEGFTTGFRAGTGENNSPVSQNQSLGAAGSGQGGNFSKYSLWLDRAFLRYQSEADPTKALSVTVGRFENPFLSTSVLWADDLGFDGGVVSVPVQLHVRGDVLDSVRPYVVFGAFPVFDTDLNFGSNSAAKIPSNDKWLEAAQVGIELKVKPDVNVKLGGAYYYFTKTKGKLSSPFTPLASSDSGDTDARRPAFAQKGNTYMELRDLVATPANSNGLSNQWQYYGLGSAFRDLAYDLRVDYNHFEPFQVSFIAEYVRNLGLDTAKFAERVHNEAKNVWYNALAVNNSNDLGYFEGGGTAWLAGIRIGNAALQKRWDWALSISYRNVESDAVIDGFCDSDFGGGGTNVKGLTLSGSLALSKRVYLGARWMSSSQVSGPDMKNDIIQLDLNAKY